MPTKYSLDFGCTNYDPRLAPSDNLVFENVNVILHDICFETPVTSARVFAAMFEWLFASIQHNRLSRLLKYTETRKHTVK